MNASRRDILKLSMVTGVGAAAATLLPGCATNDTVTRRGDLPGTDWGKYSGQGTSRPPVVTPIPPGPVAGTTKPVPAPDQPKVVTPPPPPNETGTTSLAGLDIQPRKAWTRVLGPVSGNHNPMNGIKHITVHHEGWRVVDFIDRGDTIERLETIRGAHTRSKRDGGRGWSDVGYHFIIDRAGRIWEARSIDLQGAHVDGCNEHNLGIMCLGNFEEQQPSQAQLEALAKAIKAFKGHFKVPTERVHTHMEWFRMGKSHSTECPGRNLQAQVVKIRKAMA